MKNYIIPIVVFGGFSTIFLCSIYLKHKYKDSVRRYAICKVEKKQLGTMGESFDCICRIDGETVFNSTDVSSIHYNKYYIASFIEEFPEGGLDAVFTNYYLSDTFPSHPSTGWTLEEVRQLIPNFDPESWKEE